MAKLNAYQQAKEVVETVEQFGCHVVKAPEKHFHKYLRELAVKAGKHFVTKTVDGKLEVTRLK